MTMDKKSAARLGGIQKGINAKRRDKVNEQALREKVAIELHHQDCLQHNVTFLWKDLPEWAKGNYIQEANSVFSLILAEVDKAGLTDEQFYAIRFCIPDVDLGCTSDIANCNLCEKRAVAAAQLEAIKKQQRGEGK